MIPADLLARLREKDPGTYHAYGIMLAACGIVEESPMSEAWLLYCLMQAIRARGHGYAMEYYHGPRMVGVSIYKWGGGFEKITIGAAYCSTEAEALLRAYLASLESSQ